MRARRGGLCEAKLAIAGADCTGKVEGSSQGREGVGESFLANKRKVTFVQEKVELTVGEDEQVLPPVLVDVGRRRADNLLDVEAAGPDVVLPEAIVDAEDRFYRRCGKGDGTEVGVITETSWTTVPAANSGS